MGRRGRENEEVSVRMEKPAGSPRRAFRKSTAWYWSAGPWSCWARNRLALIRVALDRSVSHRLASARLALSMMAQDMSKPDMSRPDRSWLDGSSRFPPASPRSQSPWRETIIFSSFLCDLFHFYLLFNQPIYLTLYRLQQSKQLLHHKPQVQFSGARSSYRSDTAKTWACTSCR